MAVASNCRMRLYEFGDISGGYLEDLPLSIRAMKPKLLRLTCICKTADAIAFTEISAPTNPLAASTAVAIETISGQAGDNQAVGGHVQSMNTIGINTTDEILNRTELMHATDGTTFLLGTQTYKELFHMSSNAHGTGDMDAAGQIDIRKIDDTVLVSIAAASNESNGSRWKVPDGCVAMLYGGHLNRIISVATDEGVRIRIVHIDAVDGETGMAAADRRNNFSEYIVSAYQPSVEIPKGKMYTSGAWISLEHSSMVDAGEDYFLEVEFLIWKK